MKHQTARTLATCIVCVLSVIIFVSTAMAEYDLSSMSYKELVALKDQINMAMWQCKEWKQVTVPSGVWLIGQDIPEGHWTIRVDKSRKSTWVSLTYCSELDETGLKASSRGIYVYQQVSKPNSSYEAYAPTEIDIELHEGRYLIIENGYLVFTPYEGKPSLGFE